mgnify:CR=1 FL=1
MTYTVLPKLNTTFGSIPKRRCYINSDGIGFKLIYRILVLEEHFFNSMREALASAKSLGFTHAEIDGLKEVDL